MNPRSQFFTPSPKRTSLVLLLLTIASLLAACNETPTKTNLLVQETAHTGEQPTLADFWAGSAEFVLEVADTGLPMGESETIVMADDSWWSYVHASQQSAGAIDQCGDPVAFPGCTVLYTSADGGITFAPDDPPVCLFECVSCPCESEIDHVDQQQYPDVFFDGSTLRMVYEYRGRTMLRQSADGITWSPPQRIEQTGVWKKWLRDCPSAEEIGAHPFVPYDYECLAGAPPGIYVDGNLVYVLIGVGQNPGGMGCYIGTTDSDASFFQRCENNPLFEGADEYGPLEAFGIEANRFFDFKTVSSAEIVPIIDGDATRYYMLYEGVRGPGPGDAGDTQFGLGLARSRTDQIDGLWETFADNPILVDVPANVGIGHADIVIHNGQTILYTSLDGETRSRLILNWKD
jgi:hypothetical protein